MNDFDTDRDVLNEVMMKKMQSNTKKANLLEASIIGQAGNFGVSVFKQGLDLASTLKKLKKDQKGASLSKEEEDKINKELKRKSLIREGMKFFAENSSHIEVLRNKKPEKVYFHLQPCCHFLSKEVKNNFNDTIDRSNVQTKALGLVENADETIRIMKHEEKLISFFNRKKIIGLFANHIGLWENLSFTLALAVNLIIISSYSGYFGDEEDEQEKRLKNPRFWLSSGATWTLNVLRILAIVMLVASLFVVLFVMLKKMPLVISKIWEGEEKEEKKPKGLLFRFFAFVWKLIKTLFQLLTTPKILYYLVYGLFAVLGVIIHPFFLAFHLTEVLIR